MVSVPASCAVDLEFEPRSAQIKDYDIGICYLSAKNTSLRGQNKDCLAKNDTNVSECRIYLPADCCFTALAL